MKKTTVLVFLMVFLFAPSVVWGQFLEFPEPLQCPSGPAQAFYFPHMTVGGGTEYRDGFRLYNGWETGVITQNPYDDTSTLLSIAWVGVNGWGFDLVRERDGKLSQAGGWTTTLPPHASLQSVLTLPTPEVKTGWMVASVCPTSSGKPGANVFVQFRYKVDGNVVGQALVNYVQPAKKFSFYASRYVDGHRDREETGIALANPNPKPAAITITRRTRTGRSFDIWRQVIPAMSQKSYFINEIGSLGSADYEGSIEIDSDLPIIGIALQTTGDGRSFNFSTIPLVIP